MKGSHVVVSDYMQHDKTGYIIFMDEILSSKPEGVDEVKGPVDGIGTALKRSATGESKEMLYQWCC